MTDRPTGPATALKRFLDLDYRMVEWWHEDGKTYSLVQVVSRLATKELIESIEAETKARIFAALPAALRIEHMSDMPAEDAAALAAAIEKVLAEEP